VFRPLAAAIALALPLAVSTVGCQSASRTFSRSGWVASGATVAVDPTGVAILTARTAGNVWAWAQRGVRASPGTRYVTSTAARAGATGRLVVGFEAFTDANRKVISMTWGLGVDDAPGKWTPVTPVTGIAPPGTSYVTCGVVVGQVAAHEAHQLQVPSITGTRVIPAPIEGPLRTAGNRIVQANGRIVTLRGVNRSGSELSPPNFPTDFEIGQARAWGANLIRVLLSEPLWLDTCAGTYDGSAYQRAVDAEVRSITSRRMVALLDLHFSVAGPCGRPNQQAMADERYAPAFWREVAARYQANPLVAFDLYNEPHDLSDRVWLDGGLVTDIYPPYPTFLAAGMQQLYEVVRATGARNLVFVSGTDWADRPASTPVSGYNIVNAAHVYTCQGRPCTAVRPFDPSPTFDKWVMAGQARPVVVTETGFPDSAAGYRWFANLVASAEGRGWGWCVFAWDGSTSGEFDLLASLSPVYEPSPAGMPVLAGLGRNS